MEQYKQWYEDDGFTFHVQDRVYYTQCGPNRQMTLCDVLKKATDVSTEDFRQRGMSMDFLKEQGFARLVSRSSFRIHRMPFCNERIEIITAEEKPEGFQLAQSYEFVDEAGNSLISGESTWMLVDPQSRRIIPAKNLTLRKENPSRKQHDCMPVGRISVPQDLHHIDTRRIRPSHLDGNGHTDNAWYMTFVLDALPQEYALRVPHDFRINYSKELLLGDSVELFARFDREQDTVTVIGKKEGSLSFESELYF